MQRGYKVTDREGYSVSRKLRKNPPAEGIIKYNINEWTFPYNGMGPLAIFRNKKRALKFKNKFNCYGFKIFECEYVKSKSNYLWDGLKKLYKSGIINGTVFASKVKLIKEID